MTINKEIILNYIFAAVILITMIQRKQTIYLFFAGLITLVLLFLPLGTYNIEKIPCLEYNAFAIKNISENFVILHPVGNAILLIITSILSFITIFMYKNRKLQMKLISLNLLVLLATMCVILFVYPKIYENNINLANTTLEYNYFIIISFVSAIGLFLAKKAIMKDEALIKSADRLR
jgi:hypothetical protein